MFIRAALFLAGAFMASTCHAGPPKVEADGTLIRVETADGRVLHSQELIGAKLMMSVPEGVVRVRLDAVEPDPDDRTGKVWLHSFSIEDGEGNWQSLCAPGPDGRRQGFLLAGRTNRDGSVGAGSPSDAEIVCTSGARGKCVRFGYHPWETTAAETSMLPLYNACIRMVRADYGGDNHPYTRNGMLIDLYDDAGIQKPESSDSGPFEAGWNEHGAVCIAHPRVPENGSLEHIARAYPRLREHIGPADCTEEKARALGALIFNRSAIAP